MVMSHLNRLKEILFGNRAVLTWSGGLDTTALIPFVIEEFEMSVYPIFVNRHQENYEREKQAISYYTQEFQRRYARKFNSVIEVEIPIPPNEFRRLFPDSPIEKTHALRNSDIVNQAIRYGLLKDILLVLVGSNAGDTFADNSASYWAKKTEEVREGTGIPNFRILPPFQELRWNKKDVVLWCKSHSVEIQHSWSCWYAAKRHCGKCTPCVRRKEAFKAAMVEDHTEYESP